VKLMIILNVINLVPGYLFFFIKVINVEYILFDVVILFDVDI